MEIRLNKFLAERVGLSRRQADDAIASGKVTVNGKAVVLGARIQETDQVVYQGKLIPHEKSYTYLKFNKPEGYVCSRRAQGDAETIYALLPEKYKKLKTVGRLDKNSCGLILLTDDGDTAFRLTHPKFAKHKLYEVILDRPLEPLHQQLISDFGVDLPDGKSKLELTRQDDSRKNWQVGMSEGRNRQIRRTFEALGYRVTFLKRFEFDHVTLGDLPEGQFSEIAKP